MTLPPHITASRKERGKRLLSNYLKLKPVNWDQIDNLVIKTCDMRLPANYRSGPVSYLKTQQFIESWIRGDHDTTPLIEPSTNQTLIPLVTPVRKPIDLSNENSFGEGTLFSEQLVTYSSLRSDYLNHLIDGAINNATGGAGKSFLALALIYSFAYRDKLHETHILNRFRLAPYVIVTRKTLIAQWREYAREMGLSDLLASGKLQIIPYSHLSSLYSRKWYEKEYDGFQNKWVFKWHPQSVPLFIVFDEAQALCNELTTQTQAVNALIEATRTIKPCYTLCMSATLADTVAKMGTCIATLRRPITIPTKDEYGHDITKTVIVRSTSDWYKEYSFLICGEPTKSNNAAMKRLRDVIDPYIYEIENVRWPARARNRSLVVDFRCQEDRIIYDNAYRSYEAKIAKLGKTTVNNPLAKWIAFGCFRQVVEPMRNHVLAQRIKQNLDRQVATCIGHSYKGSCTDLMYQLDALGIKRDQVSLIWGGGKDYDEENTFTEQQLNELIASLKKGDKLPRATINKMRRTLAFREELVTSGEDEATRYKRYERLRHLGMTGSQSSDQRWNEIQRFQKGITKVCIFTLASGGVGLSLDQNKPTLWPRELIAGLCLSGPEFVQVLFRCVRRGTMPGYVDQYMSFMRNTVEDKVLKPLIERKYSNIRELGTKGIDPTQVVLDENNKFAHQELTIDELNALAESEDSQLKESIEEDDDEEEATEETTN